MQNNLPWRHFPLADRIREEIPVPVVLDNDVCMAAHGEWMKRGGSVKETFVYFTISTGIACCTVHRGGFSGERVFPEKSAWRSFRRMEAGWRRRRRARRLAGLRAEKARELPDGRCAASGKATPGWLRR